MCVCVSEAQLERELNGNVLSVAFVNVCSSLHVAAFPYSPGVRWGLLSSNWTYWPLFSLSATWPLMCGKSFTLFPRGSTFQQHTHTRTHIQKHTCTYAHRHRGAQTHRREGVMRRKGRGEGRNNKRTGGE